MDGESQGKREKKKKNTGKNSKTKGKGGKNGSSYKSMSWVMKIQESCMLAFITKPFLEGKVEINSVVEAWGLFCSIWLVYLLFPSPSFG